jgi:hypothetical protein
MKSRFVRGILQLTVLGLVAGTLAHASVVPCATSGSFADLIATNASGGCTIADKLFSEFSYQSTASPGAVGVEAGSFGYNVVADPPIEVGFQFAFGLTALPGQNLDILIGWKVTGPHITSNHMVMNALALGNASATVSETYCPGGILVSCPNGLEYLSTYFTPAGIQLGDSDHFDPVNTLQVLKDINVTAGAGGFAHISALRQTVDQAPEPATLALAGFSLLGLVVLNRRMRRQ